MAIALAGSLGLHAAVLSLPLGSMTGEGMLPAAAAARAIRVTFRALAPDAGPVRPRAIEPEPPDEVVVRAPQSSPDARPRAEPRQGEAVGGVVPLSDTHHDVRQLTEIPRPLSEPPLAELERMVPHAGAIRMTLFIDETGKVTAVDVQSATLPVEVVVRAAAIFSEVRFSPGKIGPNAVKSRVGITVGAVSERSYAQ